VEISVKDSVRIIHMDKAKNAWPATLLLATLLIACWFLIERLALLVGFA